MLAPIAHSPPRTDETGIEVPVKVGRHLGLDDDKFWIKTHQVNTLTWPKDQLPFGVVQTKQGDWSQGMLPDKLSEKVFNKLFPRLNATCPCEKGLWKKIYAKPEWNSLRMSVPFEDFAVRVLQAARSIEQRRMLGAADLSMGSETASYFTVAAWI